MAYVDVGQGAPVVLLHGNPTSSFLWRSVIPELSSGRRCIAPDLIGMGDSDKLPLDHEDRYTFRCHRAFLDALLDTLELTTDVTLVVHDWGSALGFDWARRHPKTVRAIAYMEALVRPLASWDEWPETARRTFQRLRSPAGEEMILEKNLFVERILPASILRALTDDEMNEYRRPFATPGENRLPTLSWPRQIPITGEPSDVADVCQQYADWLQRNLELPKLFINADPGTILTGTQREFCRRWPNQTEITEAPEHFDDVLGQPSAPA